jgi:hypothetical protein
LGNTTIIIASQKMEYEKSHKTAAAIALQQIGKPEAH